MKSDHVEPQHLAILHLSDIHIRSESNSLAKHCEAIAAAASAQTEAPTTLIIILSGDIAFSGKLSQYSAAKQAIEQLKRAFNQRRIQSICVLASPGNHDKDFDDENNEVSNALINSNRPSALTHQLVKAIAQSQGNFFAFANEISPASEISNPVQTRVTLRLNGIEISIDSLNSALFSTLNEIPGRLGAPIQLLAKTKPEARYCVAVLHHPLNWFEPENMREVSRFLSENYDAVFYGHEHTFDDSLILRHSELSHVRHVIADALDPEGNEEPGFALHVYREQLSEGRSIFFKRNGRIFQKTGKSTDWWPTTFNPGRQNRCEITESAKYIAWFKKTALDFQLSASKIAPTLFDLVVDPVLSKRDISGMPGKQKDPSRFQWNLPDSEVAGRSSAGVSPAQRTLYRARIEQD